MVEAAIQKSARRALGTRALIDYKLTPGLRTPIGVWIDDLRQRKLITLVPIVFSIGRHSETIPAGFIFDGASIPRIFWGLKGFDPYGQKLWAALLHDWHCDQWDKYERQVAELTKTANGAVTHSIQPPLPLVVADALFVSVLLDTGEETWRSIVMYLAVRAHHTFPQASLWSRRLAVGAKWSSAGGVAAAGGWWIIKNLIL